MQSIRVRPTHLTAAVLAVVCFALAQQAHALTYIEVGGVVSIEGEAVSNRVNVGGANWLIVPTESASAGTLTNFRGAGFLQNLPDGAGVGGGPNVPPTAEYSVNISTPGLYRMFLRWDGNATSGTTAGSSDSIYADIIELKDGPGGAIADHYEFQHTVDGSFNSVGWDSTAGKEETGAGILTPVAPTFSIANPGTYTVRVSRREDGAAVDAIVLQLNSLAAPTNTGPVVSLLEGPALGQLVTIASTNDAYVRSGVGANDTYGTMDPGNLLIKSSGTDTTRKPYIQFNIDDLAGRIQDAALDLQVNANNGNPANTTGPAEYNIEVFALNDGVGDTWDESTLTFANAPGNAAGNGVDGADTTFLGSFHVAAINPALTSDPIFLSFANFMSATPDALTNFLNADTDGLVTFILRRSTAGDNGSFNLSFYSSENGGGLGPQLRLNVADVPEPATALLALVGLPLLMRRRRAA